MKETTSAAMASCFERWLQERINKGWFHRSIEGIAAIFKLLSNQPLFITFISGKRFDNVLKNKAQKREFRKYLGGLLGESERKNLSQIARDSVGVTYHRLDHFLTEATWSAEEVNDRRLEVINKCNQTRINSGFSLIVDDSGHRKSGNFTRGVGRQYIGEIGKTDNGNVIVTTHL